MSEVLNAAPSALAIATAAYTAAVKVAHDTVADARVQVETLVANHESDIAIAKKAISDVRAALKAALAEAEAVLPNVSADVAKVEAIVPAVEAKAKGLFARLF